MDTNIREIVENLAATALLGNGYLDTQACNALANHNIIDATAPPMTSGSTYIGTTTFPPVGNGCQYVYNIYPWWPGYWPATYSDFLSRAFRIVKMLMDKKAIKLASIEKFVELVDEISKIA